MYDGSLLSMWVSDHYPTSPSWFIGLRQGCPLTAALFDFTFIDGLHHQLQTTALADGVCYACGKQMATGQAQESDCYSQGVHSQL